MGLFSISIFCYRCLTFYTACYVLRYKVYLVMLLQLYSAQAAFVNGGATQARSFAKDTASDRPPVSGDGKLLIILFYAF